MTRNEFINFLNTNGISHKDENVNGLELVYVYGKSEKVEDPMDPNKVRDFVPYLRVSHFDESEDRWYTRDCGYCSYKSVSWILKKCKELGGVK